MISGFINSNPDQIAAESICPLLSALSATIVKGWGSPAMSEHSKRSIEQYYAEYPENERLSSARGQLEFERTKRIVQRFLPSPPGIVADVGGGTGPYSFWLSSLGYNTHLIEPSIPLAEGCRNRHRLRRRGPPDHHRLGPDHGRTGGGTAQRHLHPRLRAR